MFGDAIDSHYAAVKTRIKDLNPNREVLGLLNAQDWPSKNIKTEAFYLLVLPETPGPIGSGSASVTRYSFNVQWVWIIAGTDLPGTGVRKANRGDRFRTQLSMKQELMHAVYPYYAEKKSWTANSQGAWYGTPLDPVEFISWSRPKFMDRQDKTSGLVYGSAAISISNMLDQIIA